MRLIFCSQNAENIVSKPNRKSKMPPIIGPLILCNKIITDWTLITDYSPITDWILAPIDKSKNPVVTDLSDLYHLLWAERFV